MKCYNVLFKCCKPVIGTAREDQDAVGSGLASFWGIPMGARLRGDAWGRPWIGCTELLWRVGAAADIIVGLRGCSSMVEHQPSKRILTN